MSSNLLRKLKEERQRLIKNKPYLEREESEQMSDATLEEICIRPIRKMQEEERLNKKQNSIFKF